MQMAGLHLGSVSMSLDHVAMRAHVEAWGVGHNWWPCWYPRTMPLLQPGWFGWPGLSTEAIVLFGSKLWPRTMSGFVALLNPGPGLMSVAPETIEDCTNAQGLGLWPYSSQGLNWCLGLLLSLRAMRVTRVWLATLNHVSVWGLHLTWGLAYLNGWHCHLEPWRHPVQATT